MTLISILAQATTQPAGGIVTVEDLRWALATPLGVAAVTGYVVKKMKDWWGETWLGGVSIQLQAAIVAVLLTLLGIAIFHLPIESLPVVILLAAANGWLGGAGAFYGLLGPKETPKSLNALQ